MIKSVVDFMNKRDKAIGWTGYVVISTVIWSLICVVLALDNTRGIDRDFLYYSSLSCLFSMQLHLYYMTKKKCFTWVRNRTVTADMVFRWALLAYFGKDVFTSNPVGIINYILVILQCLGTLDGFFSGWGNIFYLEEQIEYETNWAKNYRDSEFGKNIVLFSNKVDEIVGWSFGYIFGLAITILAIIGLGITVNDSGSASARLYLLIGLVYSYISWINAARICTKKAPSANLNLTLFLPMSILSYMTVAYLGKEVLTEDLTICIFNSIIFTINALSSVVLLPRLFLISCNLNTHNDWCIEWTERNYPNSSKNEDMLSA